MVSNKKDKNNNQLIPRTIAMQDDASARSELLASSSLIASVDSLNIESGLYRSILTDLLKNALKDEKVAENLMQRYKVGKSLISQTEEAKKRATTSIIFKCDQVVLNEKVLELVEEK